MNLFVPETKSTFAERLNSFDEAHCWQYEMRLQNLQRDLEMSGFTPEYVAQLTVSDFVFVPLQKSDPRAIDFIKRHEWLGTIPLYATHWFGCFHGGEMAGVVIMSVPNAFSSYLGEETKKLERLISRGACVSWSPKNLASSFVNWCMKWMVKHTEFRLFTAYSDPKANEIGTIYQACNFFYLGQASGTKKAFINPYTGKIVSDRFFRMRSAYKKYAEELNISWKHDWCEGDRVHWQNIPDDVEQQLRNFSKKKMQECETVDVEPKHKYAYVLGKGKKETKRLRKTFIELNGVCEYPKR